VSDHLETVQRYLSALERFVVREELAEFFTADGIQIEYPNRLAPNGASRDLAAMLEGNERGRQLLSRQRFTHTNVIESGDQLALELIWTGTLAIAAGTLPAGSEMRAHFAAFLTLRDGKIAAQRNYDCFDVW